MLNRIKINYFLDCRLSMKFNKIFNLYNVKGILDIITNGNFFLLKKYTELRNN